MRKKNDESSLKCEENEYYKLLTEKHNLHRDPLASVALQARR